MANLDGEFLFSRVTQQAYDGASTNYRLEQQGLVSGEADTLAARELRLLQQRSHHAIRNNGWATAAFNKHAENLSSIKVRWKDEKGETNKKMQLLWDEFAANPNLDGYGTLDNTQDTWNRALFSPGEVFCRMYINKRDGFTIPLVLQNIEAEYLDPMFRNNTPETTRNGITFANSKPAIYHFSKRLPTFNTTSMISADKVNVPAEDVIHIFARTRANQWRGIPTLASILMPLYELDDLTDATVNKQKSAQAISWVISNTNPTSALAVGSAVSSVDPNDIDQATGKIRTITQASGGGVQYLNKGESITPVQGTGVGTELIDLIKFELHKIAQACGLTYESLTGDLTGLSFSSLQQAALEMKTRAEFIYKFYTINLGLTPLCNRFQELAGIYGNKKLTSLTPSYQFPRRYSVNELKDGQADLLEVSSGFAPLQAILDERGYTFEEIISDKKKRKELNLVFDMAPTVNGQVGNVKPNPNSKG